MSTHAKFSPSASSIWLKCALYPSMKARFPDTSSAASEAGTRLHDLAEKALITGVMPADATDCRAIVPYIEHVRKVFDNAEAPHLIIEGKVQIFGEGCEGTLDAGIVSPEKISVIDLKTGTSPVKAFENTQLILYAIGVIKKHKVPDETPVDITIVQPRKKTGWPVDVWSTTTEAVMRWVPKFEKAMARAEVENPPAIAGSHCFWCPGKLHCDEYRSYHGMKRSLL